MTPSERRFRRRLRDILAAEESFVRLLAAVRAERLPDAWIAAGALRNPVWDRLHGYPHRTPPGDVDVVYFDPIDPSPEKDREVEQRLTRRLPDVVWEAVNQAWIHHYNQEPPYSSTFDALSRWTETCTSVAARLGDDDEIEILAPHGVEDLMTMVARPNLAFANAAEIYAQRTAEKRWPERWPKVRVLGLDEARRQEPRPGDT